MLPKVFIGCSTSSINIAKDIQRELSDVSQVKIWNEGTFQLGQGNLGSLMKALDNFDFAILILTPDDKLVSDKNIMMSPRDNVIFELGLFMGRLGRNRAFVVMKEDQSIKVPSDLNGIIFGMLSDCDEPSDESISSVCNKIRTQIQELGVEAKRTKEIGVLYRLLNACTYPLYPDVQIDVMHGITFREPESFRRISELTDFINDLFVDYVHPLLNPRDRKSLRVYFAYFLGDGIEISDGEPPYFCASDTDSSGNQFDGQFVIAMSNPEGFEENSWRVGRAISGFNGGVSGSMCAKVFRDGSSQYKSDLAASNRNFPNYDTPDEQSLLSVPVEWRSSIGRGRLGIITVSSKHPDYIREEIRIRIQLLGHIIGYLCSLYAHHNNEELKREIATFKPVDPLPVGVEVSDIELAEDFVNQVLSFRRKIAVHFERKFLHLGSHSVADGKLSVAVRK